MKCFNSNRRSALGLAAFFMCVAPAVVSAEGFDLQQFSPMPNLSGNLYSTASADVAPHFEWSAMALFNYASNPLILSDAQGNKLEALVKHQATVHMMVSLGLLDWVDVGVDVPLTVWQEGTAVPGGNIRPEDGSFGVGDIRFVPKVKLFSTRKHRLDNGIALALLADVYAPTGDSAQLQGGDFRIGPRLAFDALVSGTRLAANVGYQYRAEQKVENLSVQDTLSWNVGVEVPLHENFRLTGEAFGRITPGAESFESYNSPTEFVAGGKFQTGRLFATAGGGFGIVNGYGTPEWRGFVGLGFAPPLPVHEIVVEEVVVVVEPDCTVENVASSCLEVPAASCVESGLRTHHPVCLEGECAYESADRLCPENSYCGQDEAGIAACIPEPDCRVDGDCTEPSAPTCANNVLTTFVGQCREEKCHYEPTQVTCPARSECGIESGVATCVPVVDKVVVKDNKIVIMDVVHFALNSDVIEERSFDLLSQVAQILKNHPEIQLIRIEGHTDSRGKKAHNQDLSDRRAKSVLNFLIGQRIDANRLTSQGFGPDRPVESNNTEKGRAANRRVEFHILDKK